MRVIRYFIFAIICLVALWCVLQFRLFWSFGRIEQHAKKVITGSELQQWAAKILAEHPVAPGDYCLNLSPSESRTLLPQSLLGLYRDPPEVLVFETTTNSPGRVVVMWAGGRMGYCGFKIGPTNLVSYNAKDKWQDGVYFWSRD